MVDGAGDAAMTKAEIALLREIAQGDRGCLLSKACFLAFPHKLRMAKNLMWRGYITSGGNGHFVKLTPVGRAVLTPSKGAAR